MIQVLKSNKKPTFLDRLAKGFQQSASAATELIPEEILARRQSETLSNTLGKDIKNIRDPELLKQFTQEGIKEQARQQEMMHKLGAVDELKKTGQWENLSDLQKFAIENEIKGLITGKTSGSLINAEREAEERDWFDTQPNVEEPTENPPENRPTKPKEPTKFATKYAPGFSQEQLTKLASGKGAKANWANLMLKNREREEDFQHREQKEALEEKKFGHRETAKYGEEVRSAGDQANDILEAIKEGRKAIASGKTGGSFLNIAHEYLKHKGNPLANLFTNETTQTVANVSKTLAGGGFKQLFSSKGTQREFFWFENILPNLLKDAATNEKSLKYFEKFALLATDKAKIYDEIVKENGGYRPIDIEAQVRDRLKPESDKLVKEGYKELGITKVPMINDKGVKFNVDVDDIDEAAKEGFVIY